MMIKVATSYSNRNRLDFEVSTKALEVLVKQASLAYQGTEGALEADFTFEVEPSPTYHVGVFGYVVQCPDGAFRVMVDDFELNGSNAPCDLVSAGYVPVLQLFDFVLPPGATSLDDVPIVVRRTILRERRCVDVTSIAGAGSRSGPEGKQGAGAQADGSPEAAGEQAGRLSGSGLREAIELREGSAAQGACDPGGPDRG